MDFQFDPSDAAFREEVSAFVKEKLPADIKARGLREFHLTGPDQAR